MSETLKPGLYLATVNGMADVIVTVENGVGTTTSQRGRRHTAVSLITDARPVIVLDLSAWISDAQLVTDLRALHVWSCTHIADQIEAQTKPARIPEPKNVGSLVTASRVGGDGSDRVWTRFSNARTDCWIDSLAHVRSWSDLTDPEPYPFGGH